MDEVRFAKDRLFSDISGLEKIEVDDNVKDVGGLEGLRKWLDEKKELLSPEKKAVLRAKGLLPPTGLCRCNSQRRVHASIRIVATRTFRKRQTIRLTLNQRRFISGAVFCIRPEVLQPKASSDPDQQDLYFPVHHKVLAAP